MKPFLEALEELMIHYPDILISSTYSNAKIMFVDSSGRYAPVTSRHRAIEAMCVTRMIRDCDELRSK